MLKVYQKIIGLLLLTMSFGLANDYSPVHYQAKFSVNNMMCEVMINGMPIVNTMDVTKGIPRLISLIEPVTTCSGLIEMDILIRV